MKVRKVKDIQKALRKKGFALYPEQDHHQYYYLEVDGKKTAIYTYFSQGQNEYGKSLMSAMKKQLRFQETKDAELFFDCPMTKEKYIQLLKDQGDL